MDSLVKGCFGSEFYPNTIERFSFLRCGQMRSHETFGHNSGWYNKRGEKLGWGDLNAKDVKLLMEILKEGEFFITMSEHNSFWNFVDKPGMIGSMSTLKEVDEKTEDNPGIEYLFENAIYIITKDKIYCHSEYENSRKIEIVDGIEIDVISTEEVIRLLS